MVSQALLDYVKKELARGVHEGKLRQTLLENDWPEFEINEAFEKAKQAEPVKPAEKPVEEKPPEEVLEEHIPEEPKESVPEEKPEEVKKVSVINNVQKIITNKIFIIAAIIIVLGSVAFFVLPSVFNGGDVESDSSVMEEAKNACTQYCTSSLCGLFVSPGFPQPELNGKNCLDLGVQCKKCEVEY